MRRASLVAVLFLAAAPAVADHHEMAGGGEMEALRREAEASREALERTLVELEAVREELARTRAELDRLRAPRPAPTPPPAAAPAPARRTHTVQRGETLGSIAARYYGSSDAWPRIRDANRDVISNPNRIEVGQVFVIP